MTQLAFNRLLDDFRSSGAAVGAFNVILLEHAEAIVEGAERAGRSVILQISQNCLRYHGSVEPIVRASCAIAQQAQTEVLVHLDHIDDESLVDAGISLGVDSIMFDASRLPYSENVRATASVAARCHRSGIAVEAELGEIGGKDGVHAPTARTDPDAAAAYVSATGVDALAVAVGTSHAMWDRMASVDRPLIARLAERVPVPLVLHGSSGLPDEELRAAITAGIRKVNFSTRLNGLFTSAIRKMLAAQNSLIDPREYVAVGRTQISSEVTRLLELLARPAS